MQIKGKIILILISVLLFCTINSKLYADEFNISALEITVDKKNNIVKGKGSVEVTDTSGKLIKSDRVTYIKNDGLLMLEGSVEMLDNEGNILTSDKITYNKKIDIIDAHSNSKLIIKEGYELISDKIYYNNIKKRISSSLNSTLTDTDGNMIIVDMFEYDLEKNIFSSLGNIKIVDIEKNKYFFKELHIDTKKKEMIGSDVSVILDQENFGVSKENDPRFVANDIFVSKNKSILSKGVFTVCQKRGDRCPPWSLQAKKIEHDKAKKTIFYKHATLKVYDMPIFYFPAFYHPDPTVKRQSGFLFPFFTNNTSVGAGFALPYYWAIDHDRDMTFTPKIYASENVLLLNEYRRAFKNDGYLTLDTSYTEGYKETSNTKTSGSRNHIFAELDINLSEDQDYESNLMLKVQRTSNDTYFKIHDINTALVDSENTNLENKFSYNYSKGNSFVNISGTAYEDLSKKDNKRYEYILPNILFGKSFFTERFGTLSLKSNALYKNYDVNKHLNLVTNDISWSSHSKITKKGFVNSLEGMINNTNYNATNTTDYKTANTINEFSGVLSFKSALPMQKEGTGYSNIFSPNLMFRYAPGHMRNLSGEDVNLKYSNLYSLNKTSTIEDGLSAVLGFDFKKNIRENDGSSKEKLSLSIGQVFNLDENEDIPSSSSLDQKTSDVVGEINYNFSKIGKIDYKFSLDHNLNDLNYNEFVTNLTFGKVDFNLSYLEQRNHVGIEHYVNSGISLNFNDNNKLSFETKKNFKTESTELYDISYQYINDCLTAGLVFRREFYEDSDTDIEPNDSLMFVITFKPFAGISTPTIYP